MFGQSARTYLQCGAARRRRIRDSGSYEDRNYIFVSTLNFCRNMRHWASHGRSLMTESLVSRPLKLQFAINRWLMLTLSEQDYCPRVHREMAGDIDCDWAAVRVFICKPQVTMSSGTTAEELTSMVFGLRLSFMRAHLERLCCIVKWQTIRHDIS